VLKSSGSARLLDLSDFHQLGTPGRPDATAARQGEREGPVGSSPCPRPRPNNLNRITDSP
jgi:hypothetical protein